jgi:hypothetical protein
MRLRAVVLSLLAGTALVVPAGAASAAACTSTNAVTVVVDFASLGGGEQTRCTNADPPTGLAALREAGFTPTRAAQEPGYFVCRIDGKPANDPCQRTSPANAYWSYWHAKRGGVWSYSSLGAADYDPPPGTVEGWAFGAGTPPSSPPPPAASPAASPTSSPTASPVGSPRPTHSAGAAASPTTRSTIRTATPSASATPHVAAPALNVVPSASASAAGAVTPTSAAVSPPPDLAGGNAAASRKNVALNSGPGAGVVAAIVLVAFLVGAALVTVVRRRRSDAV